MLNILTVLESNLYISLCHSSMPKLSLLTNEDKTSLLSNTDDDLDDDSDENDAENFTTTSSNTTKFDVGNHLNVSLRKKHSESQEKKYFIGSAKEHRSSVIVQDDDATPTVQCELRNRTDSWEGNASLDNVQTRIRSLTEFDIKRCSLFTDQGYVKMYTLERAGLQFKRFSSRYNSIYSTFSTDSDYDSDSTTSSGYIRMAPPCLGTKDKQSTDISYDNSNHQNNLKKNAQIDGSEVNKENKTVHSMKARTIDSSSRRTKSVMNLTQNNNNDKSTTWSSRKPISLYERLMHEVTERLPEETALEYTEEGLIDELDFNPIESRIIYHNARGWKPNLSFSLQSWQDKFPEDFSVNELYLYITRQGNSRLAEYLRKYHVDGYFMYELVKDDMLLDDRLFDDNFVTPNELKKLRSYFYPERPRCNALRGGFVLTL